MSADVGGRLETLAPRRSLFGPDYFRIAALLAVAIAIHFWLVTHTAVPRQHRLRALMRTFPDPNAGATDTPRQRIDVIRTANSRRVSYRVWSVDKTLKSFMSLPGRSKSARDTDHQCASPFYWWSQCTGRIRSAVMRVWPRRSCSVLPVPRLTSDGLPREFTYRHAGDSSGRVCAPTWIGGFLRGMATGASHLFRPEGRSS